MAIVAIGCAVQPLGSGAPMSTPSGPQADSSAAALIEPAEVLSLDTDVYNLAYDRATDTLWFAQMRGVDPDYLYRVNAATGASDRWQLPETLHNGFLTEVEVAEDGGVWISYEYKLLRFDQSAETIGVHEFPIVQPQADQVGGTWISGIGTDGNRAWAALNGLSQVALIDSQMREVSRVTLPDGWQFPRDVGSANGQLFVVRGGRDNGQGSLTPGGIGVISLAGKELAFGAIETHRIQVIDDRVLAFPDDGQRGETAWVAPDGRLEILTAGSFDESATGMSSDAVAIYSDTFTQDPARIVRYHEGAATVLATFEKEWVATDFCHQPPPFPSSSAMETCPPSLVGAPKIDAMVSNATGTIWYFENFSGQRSILWKLQPSS